MRLDDINKKAADERANGGPLPPADVLRAMDQTLKELRSAERERDVREKSVWSVLITVASMLAGVLVSLPDVDKRVVPGVVAFAREHTVLLTVAGVGLLITLAGVQVGFYVWRNRHENEVRQGARLVSAEVRRAYRDALAQSALNPGRSRS